MTWTPECIGASWFATKAHPSISGVVREREGPFATLAQAAAHCAKKDGRRAPRTISAEDFVLIFSASSSGARMVGALRDYLVQGKRWVDVCAEHGVSNGGLHRAMHNAGLR